MRKVSKQVEEMIKIEAIYKKIKTNESYSFFMHYLKEELNELNASLQSDIEYPYNKLLKVDSMLRNMLTWKHIKVADKQDLLELKKELNIHIGRLNTTFDL